MNADLQDSCLEAGTCLTSQTKKCLACCACMHSFLFGQLPLQSLPCDMAANKHLRAAHSLITRLHACATLLTWQALQCKHQARGQSLRV